MSKYTPQTGGRYLKWLRNELAPPKPKLTVWETHEPILMFTEQVRGEAPAGVLLEALSAAGSNAHRANAA